MNDKEVWKPCKYAGYEVSNFGNIRSYWRPKGLAQEPKDHGVFFNSGYQRVTIHTENGNTMVLLAGLVAEAFLGDGDGRRVIYKDFDPHNCHADNLQWATYQEAGEHLRLKRQLEGKYAQRDEQRARSKAALETRLNRALQVMTLREMGKTFKEIGKEVGLSESGACRIYYGLNNRVLEKALANNG
jgi:hypothetical protein